MPSFVPTQAQLAWTGGEITLEPVRLAYTNAVLSWTGSSVTVGPNLTTGLSVTTPRLDRLTRGQQYYDGKGYVGVQMQALWQKNVESVESAFTSLTSQVAAIQAALDAAQAAQDTATEAAQQAQTVASDVSLANSHTVPIEGNITADSGGNITIAAHQRKYSESSTVNVDGGALTGATQGAFYRIYYTDPAREGGAVSYEKTTGEVVQSGSTHVVGGVTIPNEGSPPETGGGTSPPGYVTVPIPEA